MQYNMHADVTLKKGFSVCVCDDQREVNEKGCLLAALLVDAALLELPSRPRSQDRTAR